MSTQAAVFDSRRQHIIEEAVADLLAAPSRHSDAEHRASPRVVYSGPVQVTKDNRTEMCAAKDLSRTGVGFVHTRPMYGRVILGFTAPSGGVYRFLAEVVRAREVGRLYEIGARFVERIV